MSNQKEDEEQELMSGEEEVRTREVSTAVVTAAGRFR
jgi:hypothetical protein